jgi:hypothetical protein
LWKFYGQLSLKYNDKNWKKVELFANGISLLLGQNSGTCLTREKENPARELSLVE